MKEIFFGERADVSISREWRGEPLSSVFPISLSHDQTALRFFCRFPGTAKTFPGAEGNFYRGLWERDVAELFLHFEGGYLELHLAPNGLWWAALFRGYREEERELSELAAQIVRDGEELSLLLLKERLPFPLSAVNAVAVTAMLSGRFLSLVSFPDEKPDFHRRDIAVPCVFRQDYSP